MSTTDSPAEGRPLTDLTRDELNALAGDVGVAEPERLPNKQAVADAIAETQPVPDPVPNAPPASTGDPVAYRYTGDGLVFHFGVPIRDLTQAEADRFAADRPDLFHAMTNPAAGRDEALYERVEETN